MKDFFKVAGVGVLILTVIMAVSASLGLFGLSWQRFAAPFAEETRTQTYEQSRTYNQGMALDIGDLCRQFDAATDETLKLGLANTMVNRADRYDWDKLPSQQRRCLERAEVSLIGKMQSPVG